MKIVFPREPELLRKAKRLRPKKGQVIICLDYAALEMRIMTFYSGDKNMVRLLSDPDEDAHQNTADGLGVDRDPTAKNINFLLQFGGQAWILSENLTNAGVPTTPHQASAYVEGFDSLYPGIGEQRELFVKEHERFGFITYFTRRKRSIPDVDYNNSSSVHKLETTLANNAVQGVGQDFLKAAIIRSDWREINIDKEMSKRVTGEHRLLLRDYANKVDKHRKLFKKANLQFVLQVHDEKIDVCDASAAEEVAHILADMMCWRHPFPRNPNYRYYVPLVVEGGIGTNWLQAKGKDKKNPPICKLNAGYNSYELETK